jgi:O-antigen biosynthesis protein
MLLGPSFASPFPAPFTPLYNSLPTQAISQPREVSLPRYVNYLADYSGCGFWRILWPEAIINGTGKGCSTSLTSMVFDPRWYGGVNCVKIQRQASTPQKQFVELLKQIQKEHNFKLIYEVDDVVFREDIPDYNKFKPAFDSDEIRQNCIDIINMCDEVTVTCDFMKQLYQQRTGKKEITVIPNFVPRFWLGNLYSKKRVYDAYERYKKKPRILYAGSGAHYDVDNKTGGRDDFEHLLKFVADTRHKYQWVFMGAFPPALQKFVEDKSIEFHGWSNLLDYPTTLASLDVQLMIAPLQDNNFNRAKSDIKFIEAATLGIPCLCQDMCTYSTAPESLRFKAAEDFAQKVDFILNYKNRNRYFKNVEALRSVAETRALELPENIGTHLEVLNTPYGSSDRKYLKRWN